MTYEAVWRAEPSDLSRMGQRQTKAATAGPATSLDRHVIAGCAGSGDLLYLEALDLRTESLATLVELLGARRATVSKIVLKGNALERLPESICMGHAYGHVHGRVHGHVSRHACSRPPRSHTSKRMSMHTSTHMSVCAPAWAPVRTLTRMYRHVSVHTPRTARTLMRTVCTHAAAFTALSELDVSRNRIGTSDLRALARLAERRALNVRPFFFLHRPT